MAHEYIARFYCAILIKYIRHIKIKESILYKKSLIKIYVPVEFLIIIACIIMFIIELPLN